MRNGISTNRPLRKEPRLAQVTADFIIGCILLCVMFVCLVPMWHTLMSSLSGGQQLMAHEGLAWKWITVDGEPNFAGYAKTVTFNNYAIIKSYVITLIYAASNIIFGLVINIMGAYVVFRKPKAAKAMTLFMLFTMMFNGGLLPTYMVVKRLGLVGTPLSLVIPSCTNAMFVLLTINAFRQVPFSTVESAEMDGAGHFTVMFRVLLPQAMGLIIVVMINTAIISWNSWFEASIYVPSNPGLWPLQLWIKQIVAENQNVINASVPDWDKYLVSYAVILIATIPVLIAMPFAQRQLQKGSLIGAVKG